MYKKLCFSTVLGFLFVSVTGTLLHFAYDYSTQKELLQFFVPVNESVFEHLKLLFFPQMLYSVFEYFIIGKRYKNYIFIKAVTIIAGIAVIIAVHSFYTHFTTSSIFIVDIVLFYVSVIFSYVLSYKLLKNKTLWRYDLNAYGIFFYAFIMLIFFLCTVFPPELPLFSQPC
ncbi:MAG: hypothetical protein IJE10_05810 [Clostridia bacterium]|nr:hypothetical protein [Clostridia bacterium]